MKGEFIVQESENLERLDVLFNKKYPNFSRSHIKNLIDNGEIYLGFA